MKERGTMRKMDHHRYTYNAYARTVSTSKEVYFGKRKPCFGKIQRWECFPSRRFPFEQECEECGWMINYIDDMVMQRNEGYYGKCHYHKRCWEIKLKDNRDQPLWCARYGFGTWNDMTIEPEWIWNKDTERLEKECIDCRKMMRANPYTQAEKNYTKLKERHFGIDGKNICGRCFNKRRNIINPHHQNPLPLSQRLHK